MTEIRMSFLEHLEELRARLIKAVVGILVATIAGLVIAGWTIDVLAAPYERVAGEQALALFRPTEGFTVYMRAALFAGLIIASPLVTYQVWRFVAPGLKTRERRFLMPLVAGLFVLFVGGVALGYWALDRGLEFLLGFGGESLEPVIGAEYYLSFAMRFLFAFGVAFEFPVFLFAAVVARIVALDTLRRGRRWAVMIIVVAAAAITPSGDPITLLLLATPLYVLYEATIVAGRLVLRRR